MKQCRGLASENYGGVVIQAGGYNHAVAEHNATPGGRGLAPTKPPEPASSAGALSAPPWAGGPGRGLVDGIGLTAQVGVPAPDGQTEKLSTAAHLGPGVQRAPETPLTTSRAQIEKKFDKHAEDSGVTEPTGKAGFDQLEQAIGSQIDDPATLRINGTYRGDSAIVNFNPDTGLAVIQKTSGEFVSGWRLSPEQVSNVLQRGSLR